jgi:pyruvate-formate lyase-activating enzyme
VAALGALVLAGYERDPASFISASERFASTLTSLLARPIDADTLRLVLITLDQLLRRAEIVLLRFDQRAFSPAILRLFSDLARFLADTASCVLDDEKLAAAGRAAAKRYWLHRDPSGAVERVYWHSDTPFRLQVEVTNHCNLKCTMCPRTTSMTRTLGHMDLATWRDIILSWSGRNFAVPLLNPLTNRSSEVVLRGAIRMFYLGEFLMHPEFDQLIRIARELDCIAGVQTNGLLLARRSTRRRLLDALPSAISISIDGFDAASYESVRNGGKWEAVKRAVDEFVAECEERGLRDKVSIGLATILADDSEETREKATDFLGTIAGGSLPISYIPLTTTNPTQFIRADGSLGIYEFQPAYQIHPGHPSCLEPLQKMQILWDGTVAACCVDSDGVIRVGRAGMGVDTVWNGPELRRLKEAHLRHDLAAYPFCRKCLGLAA